MKNTIETLKNNEIIPAPLLSDLDVKGREIAGLEPKIERFGKLKEGVDIQTYQEQENIVCDIPLPDAYLFINPNQGSEERLVEAPHWRSINTNGNAKYTKADGRPEYYYVLNTKGCGYLKPTVKGNNDLTKYDNWIRINEIDEETGYGIATDTDFYSEEKYITEKTKELTDAGLRTELYYSVAIVKKLFYKNKLTPVPTLKKQGIIPKKNFKPEIGIRLIKINTRIAEVAESEEQRAKYLFEQAFSVFNRETKDANLNYPELKIGNPENEILFFNTFFERMGKNLAIYQNLGLIGWQLHSANVTMAAEIVDVADHCSWKANYAGTDNEEYYKKYNGIRKGTLKDARDIAYSLKKLIEAGQRLNLKTPFAENLVDKFMDSFNQNLNDELLKKQEYNREQLLAAFRKILKATIINHKNLRAIKHGYNIEDWQIGFTPDL